MLSTADLVALVFLVRAIDAGVGFRGWDRACLWLGAAVLFAELSLTGALALR